MQHSQQFQIVGCVECKLFQVDIVKKVKKWTCKVCNTKQSLKKVFYSSSAAKDCREKAQIMNEKFHQNQKSEDDAMLKDFEDNETQNYIPANGQMQSNITTEQRPSMWAKFAKKDEKVVLSSAVTETSKKEPKLATASNNYRNISSCSTAASYSSGYSRYRQPKTAPLPKLMSLHKNKTPSVIKNDEPAQKKLKLIDDEDEDDFTISQEDLNFIDSLH